MTALSALTGGEYPAVIARVVDGDTFDADVTMGSLSIAGLDADIVLRRMRVRLAGCNAAESNTQAGKAAKAHLTGVLPAGTPVTLTSVRPYKYGLELVADVQTPTSSDLVRDLIEAQWAAAWDGNGSRPIPPWPRTIEEKS